jgi:hypothetical protein
VLTDRSPWLVCTHTMQSGIFYQKVVMSTWCWRMSILRKTLDGDERTACGQTRRFDKVPRATTFGSTQKCNIIYKKWVIGELYVCIMAIMMMKTADEDGVIIFA